jgi:hypothetical protein
MSNRIITDTRKNRIEYGWIKDSTLDLHVDYEDLSQQVNGESSDIADKAALRKGQPLATGVLAYFPDALKKVAECSVAGQKQHNVGEALYWDKSKSSDNADALVRHLADHYVNPIDDDGTLHLAKVAWRALATLQIYLDGEQRDESIEELFTNAKAKN